MTNHNGLGELMFDEPNLSASKFYFTILQLLRIFEDYVHGTLKDITQFGRILHDIIKDQEFYSELSEADKESVSKSAKNLIERSEGIWGGLLQRMRTKQEEIKTLRDGVRLPPFCNHDTFH